MGLANAVVGHTEIILTMTLENKTDFIKSVKKLRGSGSMEYLLGSLANIDSKNSKASVDADLQMIKNFIVDELGGFNLVDQKVGDALRQWIAKTLKRLCDSYKPEGTLEHALFLLTSCLFFRTLGMYEWMLKCNQLSVKIGNDIGNERIVHRGKSSVATAYRMLGRFTEEITMRKLILKERLEKHGPKHKNTLSGQRLLGAAYMAASQWDQAELEIRSVLKVYKEIYAPMQYEIRIAQDDLAIILRDSGKDLDQAQKLFKELLDYESKTSGAETPEVLFTAVQHPRCLD